MPNRRDEIYNVTGKCEYSWAWDSVVVKALRY
jgi:hypothetical protein